MVIFKPAGQRWHIMNEKLYFVSIFIIHNFKMVREAVVGDLFQIFVLMDDFLICGFL